MHLNFHLLVFIAFLFLITKTKSELTTNCPYEYTVDLSKSEKLKNNSYLFNNDTLITPDLVRDYNFKILDNGTQIDTVEPYKRGCICAVKRCIRFCLNNVLDVFKNISSPELDKKYMTNVTLVNRTFIEKHMAQEFYPIYVMVKCSSENLRVDFSVLFPMKINWTKYEDIFLHRNTTNTNLKETEFCFDPSEYAGLLLVNPVYCKETPSVKNYDNYDDDNMIIEVDKPWYKQTSVVSSIPFFILIILIYSISSNEKTVRGKCFITQLSLVTLSYTIDSVYVRNFLGLSGLPCLITGYVEYYNQTGCHAWSCILCYDVWNCLTHMTPKQLSFRKYFFIGFSTTSLMTLLAFITTLSLSKMPKRGSCISFYPDLTIQFIFVDLPAAIAFIYCCTSYILIIAYSRKIKKEQAAYFHEIQTPKLERLMIYIRIITAMGCSWTLLFLSYLLRRIFNTNIQVYEYVTNITEAFTTFQGLFIFLIYIWDEQVRNGIKKSSLKIFSSIRRKLCRKSSTPEEYNLSASQ